MASRPTPAPPGADLVAERAAAFGRRRAAAGDPAAVPGRPEATFPAGPVFAALAIGGFVTAVLAEAGALADMAALPVPLAAAAIFLGIAGLAFVLIRLGAVDGRRRSSDGGFTGFDRDRCDDDGDGDGGGDGGGD